MGIGRVLQRREHVDRAAQIRPAPVRGIPRSLGQRRCAGADALRHLHRDAEPAPIVPDLGQHAVRQPPLCRVGGIQPELLGIQPLQRRVLVVDAVTAPLGVPADEL